MVVAKSRPKPTVLLAVIVLIVLLVVALGYYNSSRSATSASPEPNVISQSTLEEEYGIRVLLVAVTGGGGFVDVRLKFVNGEKAAGLLTDKQNFPVLMIDDTVILNPPEDIKLQDFKFEDDGTMFIMYVNSSNVVKTGTPVGLLFGDMVLEPISAK